MDEIIKTIISTSKSAGFITHGVKHWLRVERNALFLADHYDINPLFVQLFAFCHDCKRINDGHDEHHGKRAADYLLANPDLCKDLSSEEYKELQYACEWHTHKIEAPNLKIGICWDADRLDLHRDCRKSCLRRADPVVQKTGVPV